MCCKSIRWLGRIPPSLSPAYIQLGTVVKFGVPPGPHFQPIVLPILEEDMQIEFVVFNDALLQWGAWTNGHFDPHRRPRGPRPCIPYAPLTPLPRFLEDVQEEPIEQPPNLNLFKDVQDNPIVRDIT
ncbi:hypothetical protein ACEPAI_8037 [Sanghuangporus weigelae]